jgi:hypothetical protein
VHADRKASAAALADLAEHAAGMLAALDNFNAYAMWKLFPCARGATRLTGEALAQPFTAGDVKTLLETIHRHADKGAKDLAVPRRRGVAPNLWFEFFILIIANHFGSVPPHCSSTFVPLRHSSGRDRWKRWNSRHLSISSAD